MSHMYGGPEPGAPTWAMGNLNRTFPGFGYDPLDTDRRARMQRIEPFIPLLKANEIPSVPKEQLIDIMKDIKEEGNAIFKEKNYNMAGEFYTCALLAGKILETFHFVEVDKEQLSTLFSNRAACCIKMDLYDRGIDDCDFAINLNVNNLKAYYRKSSALKSMRKYNEAYESAKKGQGNALTLEKKAEVRDFDEIIRELQCHLQLTDSLGSEQVDLPSGHHMYPPPSNSFGHNHVSGNLPAPGRHNNSMGERQPPLHHMPSAHATPVMTPVPPSAPNFLHSDLVAPGSGSASNKKGSLQSRENEKSQTGKTKEQQKQQTQIQQDIQKQNVKPQQKQQKSQEKLQQTNKISAQSQPKNVKSRNKEPVQEDQEESESEESESGERLEYQGRFASLQDNLVEGVPGEEEESDDSGVVSANVNTPTHSPSPQMLQSAGALPLPSQASQLLKATTRSKQTHGKSKESNFFKSEKMGLDDFHIGTAGQLDDFGPSLGNQQKSPIMQQQKLLKPQPEEPPEIRKPMMPPPSHLPPPPPLMEHTQFPIGRPPPPMDFPPGRGASPVPTDFMPIRPGKFLLEPFNSKMDFTLVCSSCFVDGVDGMRHPGLSHACAHDIFLIRPRGANNAPWIKIRTRPAASVEFRGQFRLCMQYQRNEPCKVPEQRCTFCHNQHEVALWSMDRDGRIDLAGFIAEMTIFIKKQEQDRAAAARARNQEIQQQQQWQHQMQWQQKQQQQQQQQQHLQQHQQQNQQQQQQQQQQTLDVMRHQAQATMQELQKQQGLQQQQQNMNNLNNRDIFKHPLLPDPDPQVAYDSANYTQLNKQTAHQEQGMSRVQKYEFPLQHTHNYCLTCTMCLNQTPDLGCYWINRFPHNCSQDILAVAIKGEDIWVKIRERKNHRNFGGGYIMCRFFTNYPPVPCRVGEEMCSFAHNHEECQLWALEKDDFFSISEFILQNRSNMSVRGFSLQDLTRCHPGQFRFICRDCFFGQPARIGVQNPQNPSQCGGQGGHNWENSKILAHVGPNNNITPIDPRPFTHKDAFYLLCHKMQFCLRKEVARCSFAHSMVERDVWKVERDTGISREKIVEESIKASKVMSQVGQPSTTVTSGPGAPGTPPQTAVPAPQFVPPKQILKCPFRVIEVCGICWKKGTKSLQYQDKDRCAGTGMGHAGWKNNKICMLVPGNLVVRPLPKKLPTNCNFIICRHVKEKRKCDYTLGGFCQFAHTEKEIELWTWMVKSNVRQLEDVVRVSRETYEAQTAAPKPIPKGQTVVWAKPVQPAGMTPPKRMSFFDMENNAHYCHYCSISCNSQKQWDEHCASDRHMFNVNSDKEHQWNYRQPPWSVTGGTYELCDRHESGRCYYTDKPDMYNYCKFAHSREELDEWRERWEWRQMKREIARKEQVYSYMEAMIEDYDSAESGLHVMTDNLESIVVKCTSDLNQYRQDKTSNHSWIFDITSNPRHPLEKVALLHNKDRLHFALVGQDLNKNSQIAQGSTFLVMSEIGTCAYRIEVQFSGGIFGSFMQWVVFDFGFRPVVVRKLNMELGTQFVQNKVKKLREKLRFDRWTVENRQIVPFGEHPDSGFMAELKRQYKAPSSAEAVVGQQSVGVELNRHNYVHKMHKMLQIEEITQAQIISSYNLTTELEAITRIQEEAGPMIFAQKGEIFVKVPLHDQLSEDTDAGKLILSGVWSVLLAPDSTKDKRVFEALVVSKENFDYDGRGKDYIYLCLSKTCVREMEIQAGDEVAVQIQFQMDRMLFCRMHYAIDQLQDNDIVFPDVSKIHPSWNEKHIFHVSSSVLNEDQLKIVKHIVAERQGYSPPIVVYGPFGTGKTETLAQATMVLASQSTESRILICTHSNSAADLYIMKHFDSFMTSSNTPVGLLRVYHQNRRTNTVDAVVKRYCLLDKQNACFYMPTREDILNHRIVIITLATSIMLTNLDLCGHFSHIFIDEAAQALECETVMPLTLATERTCVVLAGDHMQISPKVYSDEACKQNFHQSLLERLFRHYQNFYRADDSISPLNILLSINYRSKMEILRFISAIFYSGPDRLVSRADLPTVDDVCPLTFYTAQGREIQESDSTSYYNSAELEELILRVDELFQNWPQEWGDRNMSTVGVVTPYTDQVLKIRAGLRKKRKELRAVIVERVTNVQGKEFRALFISTVRTRHLVEHPPKLPKTLSECDGEIGDFGFLSDQKLLNTALTRAQSLVAVVGDPVALCAIGKCVVIWRIFLKHCQNMNSIYPRHVTLDSVKQHVISLAMSKYGPNLKMLNSLAEDRHALEIATAAPDAYQERETPEEQCYAQTVLDQQQTPFDVVTTHGIFEDWSLDYHIEPDVIIKQLAQEAYQVIRQENKKQKTSKSNDAEEDALKVECIKLKEEKGHAILQYSSVSSNQGSPKRQLLGADDHGRDFDSDNDMSDEYEGIPVGQTVYMSFTLQQLSELLASQPDRYKRCSLHIESSQRMYAKALDSPTILKEIQISSRLRCGRGFHGDEVVVELVAQEEEESNVADGESKPKQGQVIGILKRATNPKYRMFVCIVEQGNTGLMVPLNRGIPKIFNVETKNRLQKTRKGHVCVYTFTKDKEIVFHHYEAVDPADHMSKLFIVRYLKWDPKFYSPLGVVVGVLPAGTSVNTALKIIDIEYYIPKKFKEETTKELELNYPSNYVLPMEAFNRRLDFRDKLTFTIDPPHSTDLDDAISIDEMSNNCLRLGVHIADVSYFVKKDGAIDSEAYTRGSSFYPMGNDCIPMMPNRLGTDMCSLLPNKDRLALTVFIQLDEKAQIQLAQIKRCVIRSKHRLTYENVESILKPGEEHGFDEKLQLSILRLQMIAKLWRKMRLGNAGLYHQLDPVSAQTPQAHLIVEEIMIQANHQVALQLLHYNAACTPLRTQPAPNEVELEEWRQKFLQVAPNSVVLTQPFLSGGKVCLCDNICSCIPGCESHAPVSVMADVWKRIQEGVVEDRLDEVGSLVLNPELHPQMAVALLQLRALQERGQYVCSADLPDDFHSHYSLNVYAYTHFTSPIRRYMDLVVHRMINALIDGQPNLYSQQDLTNICTHCTDTMVKASRYEQVTKVLHLAQMLQESPVVMHPVIESIDDAQIQLRFPTLGSIPPAHGRIRMGLLGLSDKPIINQENGTVMLKWEQRIYDMKRGPPEGLPTKRYPTVLKPDLFVVQLPVESWQRLVNAVVRGDDNDMMVAAYEANEEVDEDGGDEKGDEELSSEVKDITTANHFVDIFMELHTASVLKIQVSSELYKGMISPRVQLLHLGPRVNICLEHRQDPVGCFASLTTTQASKNAYRDEESYRTSWLRVLAIESAHNAVNGNEAAVIHNLPVLWKQEVTQSGDILIGKFVLPLQFCRERQIRFAGRSSQEDGDDQLTAADLGSGRDCYMDHHHDLLCVRYSELQLETSDRSKRENFDIDYSENVCWVGHCLTTTVVEEKERGRVTVSFRLHHSSVPLPNQLMQKDPVLATVEWIPKTLPDRRQELAIRSISTANDLAKDIALGNTPKLLDDAHLAAVKSVKHLEVPRLGTPNQPQTMAVHKALSQPFSLIWGPPGTGKTVTGARLGYLFAQLNKLFGKDAEQSGGIRPQLLYCGPSNKSVDVVANYLKQLGGDCPRLVRVYSELREQQDFPWPHNTLPARHRKATTEPMTNTLKDIALHHQIRQGDHPDTDQIRVMDARIKQLPENILPSEISTYKKLISRREKEVLQQAEIILSTCNASAALRIRNSTNIREVIIDECGMCTEPESMIPILSCRPKQVLLIGDHAQLRPIVQEDHARSLKLDRSLFERYADRAIMLTTQYRMHEAIAAFPADHFYEGRLGCGKDEQTKPSSLRFWPNGRNKPITFVHVIGHEESQSVTTAKAHESSKSNAEEVQQAVRSACMLVRRFHIPPREVVVMSQYSAQCAEIESALLQRGEKDISVSTVTAAQGSEWDYVVLSTVRSLPKAEIEKHPTNGWRRRKLGFITDEHQINVAITRARKGLIIIGNKYLLRCDPMWQKLLEHYKHQRKIVDSVEFMSAK